MDEIVAGWTFGFAGVAVLGWGVAVAIASGASSDAINFKDRREWNGLIRLEKRFIAFSQLLYLIRL